MVFYRQHGSHVVDPDALNVAMEGFLYSRHHVAEQRVQVGSARWPIQPNFCFDGSHGSCRHATGHVWLGMLHSTCMGAHTL